MIFHFDDGGDVTEVQFISFKEIVESKGKSFKEYLDVLEEEGLLTEFEIALHELQDWCYDQDHLGLGLSGASGGGIAAFLGMKSGTAATAGLGLALGVVGLGIAAVGLYVVCDSSHWSETGELISDLLLLISQSKDE